ncbi:hypothetical protein BKA66DRAFT_437683 [Pyrenochaeta sp. MPI-SDFR-AT-0127]|nr:hypothetical protein BKA66DRAFT_437683 [Pyrenochaeta sp. MPI-SDFR-AT-0127]
MIRKHLAFGVLRAGQKITSGPLIGCACVLRSKRAWGPLACIWAAQHGKVPSSQVRRSESNLSCTTIKPDSMRETPRRWPEGAPDNDNDIFTHTPQTFQSLASGLGIMTEHSARRRRSPGRFLSFKARSGRFEASIPTHPSSVPLTGRPAIPHQ